LSSKAAGIPPLAGRVGQYREQTPAGPLRRHFRCIWTNSIPADHTGPVAVVPDGCVDVLWRGGALRVAGPDITAALPMLEPGTTIVGARFRPGAAKSWLGLPMSEIVGLQVDLSELWGREADEISDRIGEAETNEARSARLQCELLRLMPEKGEPARDVAAVFSLMLQDASDPGTRISNILDRLDTSERTLRRRCTEHFGYGPKTLDRILRFQRLLAIASASPGSALSGMAYEVGYADQAHLSREVKDLTGLSAHTLVKQIAA
jgi:AraC-like DNA-binding protein